MARDWIVDAGTDVCPGESPAKLIPDVGLHNREVMAADCAGVGLDPLHRHIREAVDVKPGDPAARLVPAIQAL
jgi:hypothetical protein